MDDIFKSREEAFHTYKNGIEAILKIIPEKKETSNEIELIDAIKLIVYPNTGWGYIDNTKQMYALTSGTTSGLWMLFIDDGSKSLENKFSTLTTGKQDQLMAVTIRPDCITERWAGIFLIHELTHGFEQIYSKEKNQKSSEFFAYLIEFQAYRLLTNEKITEELNNQIVKFSIQNHENLMALSLPTTHSLLYGIDETLNEPEPKSNAEEEMRIGFYLMALSIQVGINNNYSLEEKINNLNSLLKKSNIYGSNKHDL